MVEKKLFKEKPNLQLQEAEKMDNAQYQGKWVLINKKHEVIYSDKDMIKVIEKGNQYPQGEVMVEKKIPQGTCFY